MTALNVAPPAPGTMQKLANDLYWFRFKLPFRLNHINLFAIDTDLGWLLLDCGIKGDITSLQWAKMLNGPLAGKAIAGIIVSHYHADHVGYAGELAKITDAPIYMSAAEHEQTLWGLNQNDADYAAMMCSTYKRFGLSNNHIDEARKNGNYYRLLTGDLPDVTIIEETHYFKTTTGNWGVNFDIGHSPGHVSLTDESRKLHICVDFLLPRISPNISAKLNDLDHDVLANYLFYLHKMTSCPADWLIIPGHDWPYYGGGARAQQLLQHHEDRLEKLLVEIDDKNISTNDAMMTLFPFEMTGHEVFFASCEARAHLNHLVTRGKLKQAQNSAGIDMFTKR